MRILASRRVRYPWAMAPTINTRKPVATAIATLYLARSSSARRLASRSGSCRIARPGRSIVGPPLLFAELVQALLCNGMHYRGATLSKTLSDEKSEQDLWPRARAAQRRGYNTTLTSIDSR